MEIFDMCHVFDSFTGCYAPWKQPAQGASIVGFQLVAWVQPRAAIRARPEWQHIPVIVVTAKDLTEDDRNRLAGKVENVLEKNAYTRDQLLERVSEAVATCNINM